MNTKLSLMHWWVLLAAFCMSAAIWLYPPGVIWDSTGQRVGAEAIPNGDRRMARRYRPNQAARFRADHNWYTQQPDDVRVIIEIGFLWVAGGAAFLAFRQQWGQAGGLHGGGDGKAADARSAASIPLPDSSAPASKPTYERLTPEDLDVVAREVKRAMDKGHLQLEPAVSPESDEPKTMRRRDQWMQAIPPEEMQVARNFLRRIDEIKQRQAQQAQENPDWPKATDDHRPPRS